MSQQHQLEAYLHQYGYSMTKVRLAVFTALENQEPITMNELIARLPAIDRASVYRVIALFEKLSIVRRIQIGWKYKLELSEQFTYHHHHITCTNCGTTVPLREDPTIEASLQALATEYGFTITDHQVEIQGLCNRCR